MDDIYINIDSISVNIDIIKTNIIKSPKKLFRNNTGNSRMLAISVPHKAMSMKAR